MSQLKIDGLRKNLVINPEFNRLFIDIVEKRSLLLLAASIKKVEPLLNQDIEPRISALISILAHGMLVTHTLVGVCIIHNTSVEEFHFGDVNILDASVEEIEFETDGQYLRLQYELEDAVK